jgi:ribonuclease HI
MNASTPHYLLMSEASRTEGLGNWRFVLRPVDGSTAFEVADTEPDTWGERLDLLTVVRALESLDRPSRVTLIGCTRYVQQGLLFGLSEWRDNGWRWEYFGQMAPVRDADLWQRMDRILNFHRVECGQRRFDASHSLVKDPHWDLAKARQNWLDHLAQGNWVRYYGSILAVACGLGLETASHLWQIGVQAVGGCCSSLLLHRS